MKRNNGLDIGKMVFSLLIPLLHIPFDNSILIEVIRQYFARLGVPFFFAVSGFLLQESVKKRGRLNALKRYTKRIGIMLLIWLVLYSPLYVKSTEFASMPVRVMLFKTPAYLWYLSAMLIAAVPLCLLKNNKVSGIIASVLYVLGTLFGDSYSWLIPVLKEYNNVFLTTRNGVFFAFPLMFLGKCMAVSKKSDIWSRTDNWIMVFSYALFCAEVYMCRSYAAKDADCSMYFTIPLAIIMLLKIFTTHFLIPAAEKRSFDKAKLSSSIYLLQYGVISVGGVVILDKTGLGSNLENIIIYFLLIVVALVFSCTIGKTKISKYII